jgi:hypothetical protein
MTSETHYEREPTVPPVVIHHLPAPRRHRAEHLPALSAEPPRAIPSGPTYADFLRDEEEAGPDLVDEG